MYFYFIDFELSICLEVGSWSGTFLDLSTLLFRKLSNKRQQIYFDLLFLKRLYSIRQTGVSILSPFLAKNPHHDKVTILVIIVISLLFNTFLLKSDFSIEIQCIGIQPYHTNCHSVHFIVIKSKAQHKSNSFCSISSLLYFRVRNDNRKIRTVSVRRHS